MSTQLLSAISSLAKYHNTDEHEKAFIGYQSLLGEHPHSPELHHLIGIYYAQSKEPSKALSHFLEANSLDPENIQYKISLANIYKYTHQMDKAISMLRGIERMNPSNDTVRLNLATCYLQDGKVSQAIEILDALIAKDTNLANVYFHRALIAMQNNDAIKAKSHLEKTLTLEPGHLSAVKQMAKTCHQLEKYQTAKQYFELAAEKDPNDHEFKHCAAVNALQLDEQNQALTWLLEVYALAPELEDLNHNIGAIYLTQGQFKSALFHWLKEHNSNPTTESFYNIGITYQYLNRLEDARNYLKEALIREPEHLGALVNLGANALQCFDHPLAINYYQSALKVKPDDPSIQHVLRALTGDNVKEAPEQYIKSLFDQYANHYDDHLAKVLDYQVPSQMVRLINEYTPASDSLSILDAGCGTGLMAPHLRPFAHRLVGVDLSEKMIEKAKNKQVYDELVVSSIEKVDNEKFDVIVLADVMPYIGDATDLMQWASHRLNRDGIICLSFEKATTESFVLQKTARFAHCPDYLVNLGSHNNLVCVELHECKLRKQLGVALNGYILALRYI